MKLEVLAVCAFVIFSSLGCAAIKEGCRGFLGVSTDILQKSRKSSIARSFNYDYFTCYTKSLDILKKAGSYVYAQDVKKHMIAVYVSETDTTPVGLFFTEMDKGNTMVEISSPSTYGKEVVAEKVFSGLEADSGGGRKAAPGGQESTIDNPAPQAP